ncbi:MAG: DUF1848 domain-containing protein [Desulfobulbaceae bacterium]|nr:DUF1848 domain-containing protein [Desulfobulbaceae bacterium]
MIISASRRTDIPAFYSPWLLNRLRAGSVLVRNPFNPNQVSQVPLDPQVVDGIVFWTKNPAPMLPCLEEIDRLGYRYYFQFTVTAYDQHLEPCLPDKAEVIATFRHLAQRIGPERVLWRYDPMIFTSTCTPAYHLRQFEYLAAQLHGCTRRCTLSFLSMYAKCKRNLQGIALLAIEPDEKIKFVGQLAAISEKYGIKLCACCDPFLQEQCGIEAARCIDDELLASMLGQSLRVGKASGQRPGCGCVASIDIGAYHTCPHGCRYCYANSNERVVAQNYGSHDPDSLLLIGTLTGTETLIQKTMISCRSPQVRLC